MQETGVVWEPMYEAHLSWWTKAFVLYLGVVLVVSVFRALNLMWWLWRLDKNQLEGEWDYCQAKATSMRRLSILTFLLSVLAFAWSATKILQGAAVQKVTGSAFLAGAMAETLTIFSIGVLVCAVLYGFAISYEGVLAHRKMAFNRAKPKKQFSAE